MGNGGTSLGLNAALKEAKSAGVEDRGRGRTD